MLLLPYASLLMLLHTSFTGSISVIQLSLTQTACEKNCQHSKCTRWVECDECQRWYTTASATRGFLCAMARFSADQNQVCKNKPSSCIGGQDNIWLVHVGNMRTLLSISPGKYVHWVHTYAQHREL